MAQKTHFFFLICLLGIAQGAPQKGGKPTVFVQKAVAEPLYDTLLYPARIQPTVNAALLAEIDGMVQKIHAPLGARIATGSPVLVLKNTDPIYRYAPVILSAPVEGVVSGIEVTEGSRVNRGQRLATVTDPRRLKILIEVPAFELETLKSKPRGELLLPGTENRAEVIVSGISPFLDPSTGTATAELALASSAGPFVALPGLTAQVAFKVREHQGIQIPEEAIVYRGRETFIRLVEASKAKLVPVTLGHTRKGFVEILKGVSSGDQYVLRANQHVADGEEVTIQNKQGAAE